MSDLDEQWRVAATRLVTGMDELDTALGGSTSMSTCICLCGILCTSLSVLACFPVE